MGVGCSKPNCSCDPILDLKMEELDEYGRRKFDLAHGSYDRTPRLGQDESGYADREYALSNRFARDNEELKEIACTTPTVQESRRTFVFNSGATYTGQWLGNMRHGFGCQTWTDGAKYEGEWVNNEADGRGIVELDGDVYLGEWKANVASGRGVHYHRDITCYVGQWRKDLQDGYGVETWGDGCRYEGCFKAGHKKGAGVYYWDDGGMYMGEWDLNCMQGVGEYAGFDGRRFQGSWKGSVSHGVGKYVWQDGREYRGQYVADQKAALDASDGQTAASSKVSGTVAGNMAKASSQTGTVAL
eukprot:CAMPEP_0117503340 /NCGR_PEP_ID=MMETSP0784-20121206/24278_1 /TAXON_ID=39447 /ORGANISM="" /LENGTH=299 /DNA_ID=CAMNT_0005298651 /DNA_START=176 /DNA_END=1076 /DNA_ORIENTATION=-